MRVVAAVVVALLLTSGAASAQLEWVVWGNPVGTVNTGTLSGGRTVSLTSFFDGITAGVPAGTDYTASPPVPGRPDGSNPSFMRTVSGSPHPVVILNGAQVAMMDLLAVMPDSNTAFGISDMKGGNWYRLEIQDGAGAVLPLTNVRLAHHNLTLTNGWAADYDLTLNPTNGLILVNSVHEVPDAFYSHSGLTLFTNLPPSTRRIIVKSALTQESEGISYCLGVTSTTPVRAVSWSALKGDAAH